MCEFNGYVRNQSWTVLLNSPRNLQRTVIYLQIKVLHHVTTDHQLGFGLLNGQNYVREGCEDAILVCTCNTPLLSAHFVRATEGGKHEPIQPNKIAAGRRRRSARHATWIVQRRHHPLLYNAKHLCKNINCFVSRTCVCYNFAYRHPNCAIGCGVLFCCFFVVNQVLCILRCNSVVF